MQRLFYGGDIITMDDTVCEAVIIKDGKIQKTGSYKEVKKRCETDCILTDLKGKCLMPSFIDAHSHLLIFANTLRFVPLSGAKNMEDVKQRFFTFMKENHIKEKEWVIGFGYDQNELAEKRHPNRSELDAISDKNPILLSHVSLHMGVLNSLGLKAYHLDDTTKDPEGGRYGRDEQGHLNGYLEEITFMRGPGVLAMDIGGVTVDYAEKAQKIYASYGITTAQEGFAHAKDIDMYAAIGEAGKMLLDVVAYVDIKTDRHTVQARTDLINYKNHFRIGGYKLFLDGSPQGKTAWLSKPYEHSGTYRGYPTYTDEEVDGFIQEALDDNKQILVHCNGDAASQQMLDAFHHSKQKTTETRPVMVHSQTLRPDQLPQLKQIGMMPSFFVAHVYHWGDTHIKNLGFDRASHISCAGSALKEHMTFTFHQDTPVILPDMLETISAAVNRETASGVVLGKDEKISVMEALKAVTIHAAYQYGEEASKGSITQGKLADLMILDKNPLKVEKHAIKNIQVCETMKEGMTIFERS